MENITLYYREGSSDKVYQVSIESKDDGYAVNFAYGRRGSTLSTGTKTTTPVPFQTAQAIYKKLVQEKTAKGYSPGPAGTPYQHTDKAERATGILPQLLNSISAEQAQILITDPSWAMQEKFDGKRLMIQKSEHGVMGINRNGLVVAIPESVRVAAHNLPGCFVLDGECLGDQWVAFDLLEHNGVDYRPLPLRDRLSALLDLVPPDHGDLRLAETLLLSTRKAELFERYRLQKKEGVVFKNLLAAHSQGRPASGGDALKFKFVESASFIVAKINAKRSVSLQLWDGAKIRSAGNVTVPANYDLPVPGSVVECRYLYAYRESGAIYQPVYLGIRDDIPANECTTSQLKYKSTGSLQAAA